MLNEDKKKSKKDKVEEGAMPDAIDPKEHRKAQREKKIRDRTKTGDEGSEIAKNKVKGPSLMGETNLVDKILDEVKSDGKVHNCKRGYYWCYEDKKCKKIPMGWHVGRGGYLARDQEDSEDTESKNGNDGNGNGGSNDGGDAGGGVGESVDILDANGKKFAEIIDLITVNDLIPVISEKRDGKSAKDSDYSLKDWFKGGGWVQTGGKYDGKPCAKQPGQTTKPYCRDADDRAAMPKDERKKRAAKKRREDPDADRKGKAKIVTQESSNEKDHEFEMARRQLATMKNSAKKLEKKMGKKGEGDLKAWVQSKITKAADYIDTAADYVANEEFQLMTEEQFDEAAGEKDACYHKVKARYSVWPSAYASGALVKCRKKGAKNWGNKTKKEEYSDWRSELTEKCWPGYEKKGMKTMFGKRYPNCVKKTKTRKEELEVCPVCGQDPCQCLEGNVTEAMRLNTKTGNVLMVVSYWRGKSYTSKLFFPQVKLPSKMEVTDEMQKIYPGCKVMYFRASDIKPGETLLTVLNKEEYQQNEDWQKVNKGDKTDGMSKKAVAAYRRENPGSKLKTAVTGKVKKGSKDAKRRKSFCARSKGQQDMHNIDCSKTPDKPVCKARRRWKC
nr:hypothetical protein [uncultured Mediterranean phage uvMED]|tara:strand:+ start:24 stop:1865 length:1842 start_codon:yes stop_codon:yes gene_type:complete